MLKLATLLLLIPAAAEAGANAYTVQHGVVFSREPRLKMNIYTPNNGQTGRPAVVLIHGGSWLYGTRYQLHWYGRNLARRGYVAAAIDYRMMPRNAFPACLQDCKLAVQWLKANADKYGIDPERIGALGNSAGGHLTALLAATTPEDGFEPASGLDESSAIKTAIVLYGVSDMSYYRKPRGYIRLFGLTSRFVRNFVTRAYKGSGDPYDAASPTHYADKNMCPTLFVHGKKDNLVPYGQTLAFYNQLRSDRVPTRLLTVPHGHAFDFFKPRARKKLFPELVKFLDEHL